MEIIGLMVLLSLQYEPELFPGLIYRMKQPKIVLLIFVSGKIVITGAKVNNLTFSQLIYTFCHEKILWSSDEILGLHLSDERRDLHGL